MDEKLIAATVGGISGLFVVLINNWLGRHTQESLALMKRDFDLETEQMKKALERQAEEIKGQFSRQLEELRGSIADKNSARSARRDYEYDALKRLYTDIEPLLFQLYESLDEAYHRVVSLARSSRSANLGSGRSSWVAHDGYYLRSTIYKLALPTVYLRLVQPKITFVDLGLDSSIYLRYLLLKLYCRSFTDDFHFAGLEPKLPYDPNHDEWRTLSASKPAIYRRQALVVGDLENIAAALLSNNAPKLFSEFESLVSDQSRF